VNWFLDMKPGSGFVKQDGVTRTERYLNKLCERTFLSLWSYPGVYRDQGRTVTSQQGKEVCDLLVVFDRHVIIFSDKDCKFPRTGDLKQDWCRWFRRAVWDSARQIWGAERWIKDNPTRLFLDRNCTRPFPENIPDISTAFYHRVVVAHDVSSRYHEVTGTRGGLPIFPGIIGQGHFEPSLGEIRPFMVGQVEPARGYVHVVDDFSLDVVLGTLDTATDFIRYLEKKEQLIESGKLHGAVGEENLLAIYLWNVDQHGERDFIVPPGSTSIFAPDGSWTWFQASPVRAFQVATERTSYLWDRMIERCSAHIISGTALRPPGSSIADIEKLVRLMSREPRRRRTQIADAIIELFKKIKDKASTLRVIGVVQPSILGDPYYVFLLCNRPDGLPEETFQKGRRCLLYEYCMVTKLTYPDAQDIVGYATGAYADVVCSEDAVYLDARNWTDEQEAQAFAYQRKLGLLTPEGQAHESDLKYPEQPVGPPDSQENCGSLRHGNWSGY
jgi:hypothetical protein